MLYLLGGLVKVVCVDSIGCVVDVKSTEDYSTGARVFEGVVHATYACECATPGRYMQMVMLLPCDASYQTPHETHSKRTTVKLQCCDPLLRHEEFAAAAVGGAAALSHEAK